MFFVKIKNGLFLKKLKLDGNLPIKLTFFPKIKMVRMVHRNLFYNKDFNIYDRKKELWRKTDLGLQNLTFEGCFEMEMILKNILEVPATIPAQFPCIE